MSVIASVSISATEFVFGRTFESPMDISIRAEPVVPISAVVMPYLWVETSDIDTAISELQSAEYVETVTPIDGGETRQLLRVEWVQEPGGLISILLDTDAVVLEATMNGHEWLFRLRFPGYDELSTFSRRCRDQEIELQLQQLYSPTIPVNESRYDLTAEQREVLATALEQGYFEVPRSTTLDELGECLGISDSAASQRLRRGLATLLENMDFDTTDGSD